MTLSIDNWNIDENIEWFVRLSDSGSAVAVGLYLTQAAAEAQTGLQAGGVSTGYGSDLEVTLVNETGATEPVSLFQSAYAWHLTVSGQNGDAARILRVKPFVEIDDIEHPIYRNNLLIAARAAAEIDAHTHAAFVRDIELGIHLPEVAEGDILGVNSPRRGVNDLSQVSDHTIVGTPDSLVSKLTTRRYVELSR